MWFENINNWVAVATILQGFGVLVGIPIAIYQLYAVNKQLRGSASDRKMANIIAIIERTQEHNWKMLEANGRLGIIQEVEGLSVKSDVDQYWHARAVHLSHLNLLWQVWELAGRPQPGALLEGQEGWQRFAEKIVAAPMREAFEKSEGSRSPIELALFDLHTAMKFPEESPKPAPRRASYEVHPKGFVLWFNALSAAAAEVPPVAPALPPAATTIAVAPPAADAKVVDALTKPAK